MATYSLTSRVKIGTFKPFRGVNDLVIKKSVLDYSETARLKLPTTARLKQSSEVETQSVLTSSQFKRGDKIEIQLGYNNVLTKEFEGFVTRINMTSPLEIECEGYSFQLRTKTINKSWQKTTLKEVLQFIIEGTDIVLKEVDDIRMSDLVLVNETGFTALGKVKQGLARTVNIWLEGKEMYAGYRFTFFTEKTKKAKADVFYKIGYNTINADDLKQREPAESPIVYVAYKKEQNGQRVKSKDSSSSIQDVQVQNAGDQKVLDQIASEKMKEDNYKGWEGKIETFLIPYCKPGYKMNIEDERYKERSGNYLVSAVETKFGVSGARRTVEISIEL